MSRTYLYKIFKIGKIPKKFQNQIESEGILLQDEGIGGSITFRNFRSPGKYYSLKYNWFTGSIVLTEKTFLAFKYSNPIIGIPWNHDKIQTLNCFIEKENTLCVEFEASEFYDNSSGNIKVSFSTPLAKSFLDIINKLQ